MNKKEEASQLCWDNFGDILNTEDVSRILRISKRSARQAMQEMGEVKIAGKWLIGKQRLIELFS